MSEELKRVPTTVIVVWVALALSIAGSIGAVWEIFEFSMDQFFGMNMQKSGLVDTMWDLIVDCIGGFVGAASGYVYLKRRAGTGWLSSWIEVFIEKNRSLYDKFKGQSDVS